MLFLADTDIWQPHWHSKPSTKSSVYSRKVSRRISIFFSLSSSLDRRNVESVGLEVHPAHRSPVSVLLLLLLLTIISPLSIGQLSVGW